MAATVKIQTYRAEEAVREVIDELNLTDATMNVTSGVNKGDNYSGPVYRIVITGTGKCGTPQTVHLILKCATHVKSLRDLHPQPLMYKREILFYRQIIPALLELQLAHSITDGLMPLPHLYKESVVDYSEYMLMEDMKHSGFLLTDRKQPFDLSHCELVLKQMGYLHGLSFVMKDQQPERYAKFAEELGDILMWDPERKNMKHTKIHHDVMIQKAIGTLDSVKDHGIIEKVRAFGANMYETLMSFCNPELTDEFCTIIHTDCWANNILFKYSETHPNIPTEIRLLDWQFSRIGSPACDLSYFFCNCTSPELKTKHYDALIRTYHESATSIIRRLGSDPEKLYPFSALEKHLSEYFRYGIGMAIQTLPFFICDGDELPDLDENQSYSSEANTKWYFVSRNDHFYQARMSGSLKHAVEKGYL